MIGFGQPTVNIPDANFKAVLVGNTTINTNGDTEIQVSEATAFNGQISCSNYNISDLTGIEAFTALTSLGCSNNQLTALDVSNNTSLTALSCATNQLTSLDVSNNTALTSLSCYLNYLTSLDVSSNTTLTTFNCFDNQLTSLDVRNGNNTNMSFTIYNNPNLYCINVDDSTWSDNNWPIDIWQYFSENCSSTTSIKEQTSNKELIKVMDILGRESDKKRNTPLFYIYNDGTVEKKIIIE